LDISSFIWEGADPSKVSCHTLFATWWKSRLFASQLPAWESAWRSSWMPYRFLNVAAILRLTSAVGDTLHLDANHYISPPLLR
jgi:hypothetical protein